MPPPPRRANRLTDRQSAWLAGKPHNPGWPVSPTSPADRHAPPAWLNGTIQQPGSPACTTEFSNKCLAALLQVFDDDHDGVLREELEAQTGRGWSTRPASLLSRLLNVHTRIPGNQSDMNRDESKPQINLTMEDISQSLQKWEEHERKRSYSSLPSRLKPPLIQRLQSYYAQIERWKNPLLLDGRYF